MKKILTLLVAASLSLMAAARPLPPSMHAHHRMGPPPRPVMHAPHYHHHHHHAGYVAGGIVGGILLGSAIASAITPTPAVAPIVVTTPAPAPIYTSAEVIGVNPVPAVYQANRVWVPGHYETRVVNGIATSIWVSGYWR